ncbi:MAG: cadherin-like domain-containing protein, partial [Pseudomonadota bacterium]
GAGFTASEAQDELTVEEYAANGTGVGTLVAHSGGWTDDLVSDGSFTHVSHTADARYDLGESVGIGSPWTVDSGNVHAQGSWDSSPLGGVAVDVSGIVPGKISQTLTTEVGKTYQLSFAMTGNFNELTNKTLLVTAGTDSASYTVSPPDGWDAGSALMWNHRSLTFTATSTTTTLSFEATAPANRYGPVIGDVQVVALPPAIATLTSTDASLSYNGGTGKFYKTVAAGTDFTSASNNAVAEQLNGVSGQLVTIDSAYENDVVQKLAQTLGENIWLGASDESSEGHWHWLEGVTEAGQFWDGTASGVQVNGAYSNWGLSEPTGVVGEDYATLLQGSGLWIDSADINRAYVIEWNADEVLSNHTYTLLSDPSGAFAVDESTGVVTVADGSVLDFETDGSHDIDVRVTDASGDFHDGTITIKVGDVPAPVITQPGSGALNYTENATLLLFTGVIGLIDVDDTHLQSSVFQITTGYQAGEDELTFTDTASLTGAWDPLTGRLTITGNDTLAAWEAALMSVGYQNTSDDPVAGSRGIEFTVSDDNELSNTLSRAISVVPVNDSPSMTDAAISSVAEDSTGHLGDTVGDLLAASANDVDGTLYGLAIAANATTSEGQWQYSTDNGTTWYPHGFVSETDALILDSSARLRFVPAADYFGAAPALTVFAIDNTYAGAATTGLITVIDDVTTRGGSTPYAGVSATINGVVTDVNDLPTLNVSPVNLLRAGIHTIDSSNIDAVDVDVDKSQRIVQVTSVPSHGSLHLAGIPMNVGDTFSQAQVDAGDLRYVNNGINSDDDAFALTFNDVGANAVATAVSRIVTVTIDETHPQGVADTVFVDEHKSTAIPVLDNDAAADEPLVPGSVTVVTPATNGATAVDAGGVITYSHDGSETTSDVFRYTVTDTGGDVSDPIVVSITVTPVNDIPVVDSFTGPASLTAEDTVIEITASDLTAQIVNSDAEDATVSRFLVTSLSSGELTIGP